MKGSTDHMTFFFSVKEKKFHISCLFVKNIFFPVLKPTPQRIEQPKDKQHYTEDTNENLYITAKCKMCTTSDLSKNSAVLS